MPLYDVIGSVERNESGDTIGGHTWAQQIAHAAAKINPIMVLGRGAFLQMVKWNVRAWAKNMNYLLQTKGLAFSDPLGLKWYLLGGDWNHLMAAVEEGKDKKMIGFTGAEITAMIVAAAPIIIAITSVIKSATGKDDWNDTMTLPGMPSSGGGSTLPTTGTGNTIMDFIKANPIPVALVAGGAVYFMTQPKKRVSGAGSNDLLIAGGVVLLLIMANKKAAATTQPVEQVLVTDMPENTFVPPAVITVPVPQTDPVVEYKDDPVMDSNILAPFVEEESPAPTGYGEYYYGGGGGGSEPYMLKESEYSNEMQTQQFL